MFGHATYIVFELAWAVPVVVLQWAVGWRTLWSRRRALLRAMLVATTYLSCTDGVAIAHGIWTLHRSRILGIQVVNVPIEEMIFFFLTNLLVVQSVLLVYRLPSNIVLSRLPSRKR